MDGVSETVTCDARKRFAELARLPDEEIPLDEAALLIQAEEESDFEVRQGLAQLNALAEEIRLDIEREETLLQKFDVLREFLYERIGFQGNQDEYYSAENSYLGSVITRRSGIPITLAVAMMEVARRVGVPLQGVGFPMHFLVRLDLPGGVIFADPYDRAQVMLTEDCRVFLDQLSRGRIEFSEQLLLPANNRQILIRMLSNLKAVFARDGQLERAISVVDRILLLSPRASHEHRDRGLLNFGLGRFGPALADLERYIIQEPEAPDRLEILGKIEEARTELHKQN